MLERRRPNRQSEPIGTYSASSYAWTPSYPEGSGMLQASAARHHDLRSALLIRFDEKSKGSDVIVSTVVVISLYGTGVEASRGISGTRLDSFGSALNAQVLQKQPRKVNEKAECRNDRK